MKIELEQVSPHEIEKRSFEIITEELNGRTFPEDQELVVKRCIHTSADFDYADNLCFSEHAVAKGIEAIREGACIVTDTQMARSGINKKVLARHGGEALCFMSDEDVAARAKETGSTRAAACMEKAAELDKKLIIAVGNAPTALVRLYELIGEGKIKPALIIGVPVGFVNVVQSKELIMQTNIPYIVARGRKGGSNIAACICNALLYMMDQDRGKQPADERRMQVLYDSNTSRSCAPNKTGGRRTMMHVFSRLRRKRRTLQRQGIQRFWIPTKAAAVRQL